MAWIGCQHLQSSRHCHVHPRLAHDVPPPAASPCSTCVLEHLSKRCIHPCPSRRERAVVAPPIHPPPPTRHATAANSPMPLQAADAAEPVRTCTARVARTPHVGAVPLAASLMPPLSRCRLPLVLKAAHAARDGPCGMLRATSSTLSRCRLPPCRPACQRMPGKRRRCCLRQCHCSIDKASTALVPRWLELRSTAALPLTLQPLSAVAPRR